VDGIGIVRYSDAVSGQLVTKSYRPRPGDRRGSLQLRDPGGQLLGPIDGGLPGPLTAGGVESGENLPPPTVENGKPLALRPGLGDPHGERVERADSPRRQTEADAQSACGRDPHPQAGEGTGAKPYREQVDCRPAARRRGRPLDLLEQTGRVQGPPLRGKPQLRLVQYLAVAPGAGDGVYRRGVEADDDQRFATP
jgi:hypothetical protein